MEPAPLIRPARPDDAASATAVAHAAKAHWGYPAAWMEVWRDDLTVTPEYLERRHAWCAAAGEELVGFCALEEAEGGWELAHLWVLPAWHGRGVGSGLLSVALATARRLRPGSLLRIVADPHAAEFYERRGARPCGAHPAPMDGAPGRTLPVLEVRL
jgi:GNAT superfamily N-acetyltransferase